MRRKLTKDDVVMRIGGDWTKTKSETDADCADVYCREDFTRASLGRMSVR